MAAYGYSMLDLSHVNEQLELSIHHGQVADEASAELAKIRRKMRMLEDRIKKKLDHIMKKARSYMQEAIVSKRHDRYVIPVKKEYHKKVKGVILDESASGLTVFIEPMELQPLQTEWAEWSAAEAVEEQKILGHLTALLEEHQPQLQLNLDIVGQTDFIFAKAKYARQINGRRVQLNQDGMIVLKQAVHPFLTGKAVPLDIQMGQDYHVLIITGPNTGGKTVCLKTVGLLTLMVQSGLLIPADESSSLHIFHEMFVDIGDNQDMEQSLSTFSSHLRSIMEMLKGAHPNTLILIDEMASGTDPGEGIGLSIAVLEELYQLGATLLVTTHYNEIKHYASRTDGFENARMEFDTKTLQPRYVLTIGEAGSSYAFDIATRLGMPERIVHRARSYANRLLQDQGTVTADEQEDESPSLKRTERWKEQKRAPRPGQGDQPVPSRFSVGDRVFVPYLNEYGTVMQTENKRGQLTLLVRGEALTVLGKRVELYLSRDQLYPDDYDMDIVFEDVETRKKRKVMSKRHVEGLQIEKKPDRES
ncbi:DNA mismatch repair protein MutS [Marinicrinis sediminis]|uniref:DNA mismatch repair protein MutS n=1 Tax=Marinicrinis sediminis TaxID=1652465 RepID=A0ABW5RC84_9BACL